MKLRESGLPPQNMEALLGVPHILDAFGFNAQTGDVAELGCGYGTLPCRSPRESRTGAASRRLRARPSARRARSAALFDRMNTV